MATQPLTLIDNPDEETLRGLLAGKSVTKVTDDTLQLSDGTVLQLGGYYGTGFWINITQASA